MSKEISGYTHTKEQLDNYANQNNPNNHADQCNPNNDKYAVDTKK